MSVNVVFLYTKTTRYSINALLASIDKISDVGVYLARSIDELLEKTKALASKGKLCIVAFSLLTTMLVENNFYLKLRELVDILRRMKCITIAGGPHASGDPVGTLRYFNIDYVFIGEAEASLRNFITALRDRNDPFSVKGIAYIDEQNRLVFTGREKPINLDDYDPFPYWRGIVNPIEITRGCPYGCFYCQVTYLHGATYRHRSIDNIVFYIEKTLDLGVRDIRFISPDSLAYGLQRESREVNLRAIEDLLESISRVVTTRKGRIFLGSFPSEVRPEHVTEETARLLKHYVSNKSIIIGGQSGSEKTLRYIGRKHSVEDIVNSAEIALKAGFIPDVDLIFGFPGETVEDMRETLKLAWKLVGMGARIHLHYYIPLPGSPFGLKPPSLIPQEIKREIWRIIGLGKGYGDWVRQEELSWRIIELHRKGVIKPGGSIAPGLIT